MQAWLALSVLDAVPVPSAEVERITHLEEQVANLQQEVASLKQQVADFRKQFE